MTTTTTTSSSSSLATSPPPTDRARRAGPAGRVKVQGAAVGGGEQGMRGAEKKFLQTWTSWAVEKKIKTLPLELSVEGECLKNVEVWKRSSPFAVLYTGRDGQWAELGKTDVIERSCNPKFVAAFQFECKDDADKELGVKLVFYSKGKEECDQLDRQKYIGEAETTLKDIVEAPKQHLVLPVQKEGKERGRAVFLLDAVVPCPGVNATFRIMSSSPNIATKKAFVVVSKGLRQSRWTPVYRSEVAKDDECVAFEPAVIPKEKLVGGDDDRAFKIELFLAKKGGNHLLLGSVQTTYGRFIGLQPGAKLQYLSVEDGLVPGGAVIETISTSNNGVDAVVDIQEVE